MNLLPEDHTWFARLLAAIDPQLHPALEEFAGRKWEPLLRLTTDRVASYLAERLAELPSDQRRARTFQDPRVLRGALEIVFSGRGSTDAEDYIGMDHVVLAAACLGYDVRAARGGRVRDRLSDPNVRTDFPCGAVVQLMRRHGAAGGESTLRRWAGGPLGPVAPETAARLARVAS